MLTIKNTDKLKDQTFKFKDKEWLIYRIDQNQDKYKFVLMYKDGGIWAIWTTQYVYINREPLAMTTDSYRIFSGQGASYIQLSELKDKWNIITKICKEKLIN